MATLEKIRNRAGLLVIVVGVALFAFIIGDFLNSGSTFLRQNQEKIADINGETISIQEYQERIDEMTEIYKMQSGTNNLPEEYVTQIRQSVFDGMVQEIVLNEAMDKLGMTVSPEELFDMVQGENVSPILQQNQMFHNPETGMFDKTALLNLLKTIDDDNIASYPADQQAQLLQLRSFWLFMEKNIKLQRMEQKYTTLLTKAISPNVLDAKNAFNEKAVSADIMYAMQSYASVTDTTISASKSEIEKLYNQRKESFKQAESKVIKYIAVDIVPSQDDYSKASADIESLKEEFTHSNHIAELVNENSEVPFIDAYFSENALDPEMKQFVTSAEIGDVYGPAFENNKYRMFRLMDKTVAPDSVKVSHMLIANTGRDAAIADSLLSVLKANGDFAAIAREYSADQVAQNGGEVGWLTEVGAMRFVNDEFKSLVFSAPLNELKKITSLYGIHLFKVTEKTANIAKYKVADIETTVSPSSKTYSNIYNELNQFISKNQNMDKMDDAAKEAGYNLLSNVTVTANDQMIGSVAQSRPVIRWAFQNKKGSISEIFECDNKFVVAAVQGTIPEGYRSLNSVESALKSEIIAQKKGEKIVNDLKAKNLNSLHAYAEAMGSSVDSVKFITFSTPRISSIGVEPKLNAQVTLSEVGQLSKPLAGNNGVYVFQVFEKNQEEAEYKEKEEIDRLNANNAYRYGYQAIQALINDAKVVDNRIRFY
ncbi:peptidyl-prolyl cis-trans isomerase D [Parabacteroides sp. PF5-5]|uniref:peptidylprolyl isomerase n=1 Tax=unclassified Parabacteroides TaxID=2649774 RepID=UPI002476482B|nr:MULTISPECIES: SurA N-terminal domain-containing protein [unclassified Parabacteroides]MDH6305623.1 peptidyl-prolyl cis-trans isomerase D [Parabacteroides sp. PH5-39]MDH6316339.1 peptidyl-prolyl cis-trans isomerase D [Parabacteroides sp. PF5-13]MDH6319822.1 peptidyl-prolyl cis-trans isomerase D [Parabacteroides sp. PH5-13]MDH6323587.1 peptidyl-prolyl cis-trans isomerase D [Parabacteroides sp. PH5-8]MDH6327526.1 peptidyl-prolyl cis-trans isomerase D [Parabacteroides sp. PH5-41]